MSFDPYATLGVPRDADRATIRAAYIARMRQIHPDLRPHDPAASHAARETNAAWDTLRDPARRAAHDRAAHQRAAVRTGVPPRAAADRRFPHRAAYSPDKDAFRVAFTRATVKVGIGVFAAGMVLLLALSGLR